MANFRNIKTWTDRLGHSRLRTFTDDDGHFWLEQNSSKDSKWAKLARQGHDVAWEFDGPGGQYSGRILVDGEIYSTADATHKFLKHTEGAEAMSKINEEKREEMSSGEYAFPKERKEPLHDAAHVRNAVARFNQVKGVTDAERDEAWKRIKHAASKFNVEINESSWRDLNKAAN